MRCAKIMGGVLRMECLTTKTKRRKKKTIIVCKKKKAKKKRRVIIVRTSAFRAVNATESVNNFV
jgi:hypothetical protein